MPRVPAHLRERALGMLHRGMRTADVARAINYNVRTVRCLRQRYRETGQTADHPRSGRPRVTTPAQDWYIRTSHLLSDSIDTTGKKCSSLMSHGFVSPGVMVGFTFIVEGMSVTQRPVLWSGIDLEVEGASWSGVVCHSIIRLSLSLMWYPSCSFCV
uniref:Paired domain-containing protein n=1 Tax=Hucho hucho TaxID=62062 RepID=A0A4W5MKE9_9TELE